MAAVSEEMRVKALQRLNKVGGGRPAPRRARGTSPRPPTPPHTPLQEAVMVQTKSVPGVRVIPPGDGANPLVWVMEVEGPVSVVG